MFFVWWKSEVLVNVASDEDMDSSSDCGKSVSSSSASTTDSDSDINSLNNDEDSLDESCSSRASSYASPIKQALKSDLANFSWYRFIPTVSITWYSFMISAYLFNLDVPDPGFNQSASCSNDDEELLTGTLYPTTWLMSSTIVCSLILRHRSRLTIMESIIQLRNDEKFVQVPNLN